MQLANPKPDKREHSRQLYSEHQYSGGRHAGRWQSPMQRDLLFYSPDGQYHTPGNIDRGVSRHVSRESQLVDF